MALHQNSRSPNKFGANLNMKRPVTRYEASRSVTRVFTWAA